MAGLQRSHAEDLLYAEARLLDEGRYADWLNSLTDDITYWIPMGGEGGDPARAISIVYDNGARLRDRVARLGTGLAHAQSPPSKTRRLIANVQIEETTDAAAKVASAFILYELRRGRERVFAGRYEHQMRFEAGRWKIAAKKAILVNNDEVIDNLTFIV
ncbi:MAG TPA: aromatic-ring-hydroxylating dioxygenase subunit beta [Candidatus Binataceae bacterium]|nr:aromatic-ring-hydroxylating dioxygenase subunit beta [Candidatus Binataceae bacterium]